MLFLFFVFGGCGVRWWGISFFTLACEMMFDKTHSIDDRCYRTETYTVCRHVHASFSPDILQSGAVKGLTGGWNGYHNRSQHRRNIKKKTLPSILPRSTTTTELYPCLLIIITGEEPNSKQLFTTSFLQPLRYLITS